ncbi:MAG: hypothetical protein JO252_00920 [Planctomycetaceae bacterium]|nr:hypothetical protein [Planctomycetaceae bacterium]MBV8555577.1 hypothetical protein [Planctomycetaceae bacterium]
MFDQVVDTFRKAIDSSLQIQQEMFRQFVQQWSQVPGIPTPGSVIANSWADQVHAIQRKWTQTITDLLNRHREVLDAQYRAGIRTIEEAFRVGEAKDPEQFRKLTEELWRQSFDSMKTVIETQIRDLQAVTQKGFEVMTKGITAGK